MNRENLQKLADGLRGPLVVEFDMGLFFSGDLAERDVTVVSGCGTAACALGHATYLVEPKALGEPFISYSRRVFGVEHAAAEIGNAWDWLFSPDWDETDNTPVGAADRIEWLLRNGLPDNADEQSQGLAPLCYRSADPQQ